MTVGIEGHEEAIKDCIRHEKHVALLANSNEMRHKMNTFVSKKLNIHSHSQIFHCLLWMIKDTC